MMPLCGIDKSRIIGVAYVNRKKTHYICKEHRDQEEKEWKERTVDIIIRKKGHKVFKF